MELLTRQIVIFDLFNGRGGVNNFIFCHARDRRAQDNAGHVAAPHKRAQPHRLKLVPDGGHILDTNPMQLDILAVREVRGRAGIITRDLTHSAQLGGIGAATIEAHAHHEVLILQLSVRKLSGHLTAQVLVALGIKAQPLEPRS